MLDSSKFGHKFTYQFLLCRCSIAIRRIDFFKNTDIIVLVEHIWSAEKYFTIERLHHKHNRWPNVGVSYFWTQAKIVCGVHAHNLSQCWQTILDVLDIHGIRCLACILLQLLVLRFDSLFKSSSLHSNWSLKFTIATITIHRLWNWLA